MRRIDFFLSTTAFSLPWHWTHSYSEYFINETLSLPTYKFYKSQCSKLCFSIISETSLDSQKLSVRFENTSAESKYFSPNVAKQLLITNISQSISICDYQIMNMKRAALYKTISNCACSLTDCFSYKQHVLTNTRLALSLVVVSV
jgi:hypothetical protein